MQFDFHGLNNQRVINYNKKLILFFLYIYSSLSISKLSKLCSLSIPAVSRLVGELCDEGKLYLAENKVRGRGNSAGDVCINNQNKEILCLNITASRIDALLCSSLAKPLEDIRSFDITLTTKEDFIQDLCDVIKLYKERLDKEHIKVAIGMHGQVDRVNGISLVMPHAPWHDPLQIKFILEQKLPCEVLVDNDCVMRALAQKWLHLKESHKIQDICVINLDYGIGSSFLINNEIYRGSIFGSGQIGHTIIDPHGKKCSCGRFGCLETIASQPAVMRQINNINTLKNAEKRLSFDEVIELYQADDSTVKTVIDFAALNIGRTIYNLLNVININKIYLYGSMCRFGDKFLEQILAPIESRPFDQKDQIKDYATLITYGNLSEKEQVAGIAYLYAEKEIHRI